MSPIRNPQCPPCIPCSWPPISDTLLIKISTWNFQGIFLGPEYDHPWHQEPCPPSLWSGTLYILKIPPSWPPFLTYFSSRYQHEILRVSFWGQNMIIHVLQVSGQEPSKFSKSPPSWPPLPDTLLIEISTRNFQDIFLGVKNIIHGVWNDHVLHVSGQEPPKSSKYPFLTPPSWHTSNWDIDTKFSGYLP